MNDDDEPIDVDLKAVRREEAAKARTFEAIGRFLFQFSQLEFTVRIFLSAQIGLKKEHFDIVTAPYDFRMLCTVTEAIALIRFPRRKEDIKDLFKKFLALNDNRNRIAHGLWSEAPGRGLIARHVARTSLKAQIHFKNPDEIEKLSDTTQCLMREFLFMLGRSPDTASGQQNPTLP